eukprot:gene11944-25025_t
MSDTNLDWLFKTCAANQPSHSTALISADGARSLTYQELSNRVEELASCINLSLEDINESVPPVISIMIDRDIGMVVGILGILTAGATYVPVDPNFPPDRQSYIFSQSRSQLLIMDPSLYDKACALGVTLPKVLLIDSKTGRAIDVTPNPDRVCPIRKRSGRDLAYVLYTSGSTGKPKGVMVPHEGVVSQMIWFAEELKIRPGSVVLGISTFCFDISVLEMFLPLLYGATLVIAPSVAQKDPYMLLDILTDRSISVMQATPTTYEMMLATGWTGDKNIDFLVGAEAFRASLVPIITNSRSFRNIYGPTETTIWASSYNFNGVIPPIVRGSLVVPVGKPIRQMYFHLFELRDDKALIPTPDCIEGELVISGIGVTMGYLDAPELTAQVFIDSPFGTNEKVYRTGDLVRRMEDGNYLFIRRLDDQVKVNGYRIELAEVEFAFSASSHVERVVVIVRNGQLAAYVKLLTPDNIDTMCPLTIKKELLQLVSKSLTSYMVPRSVTIISSWPMTPSGKTDKKALPDPAPEDMIIVEKEKSSVEEIPDDTDMVDDEKMLTGAARGNYEHYILARHICDLIDKARGRRPHITSSFASIGVDSLGAVMFIRMLSESIGGLKIYPSEIYQPGVTILTFSEKLYQRLLVEKPEVLESLRAASVGSEELDIDIEAGRQSCSKPFLGFDDVLLANKKVLEGLRGMALLLVFWEHFRGQYVYGSYNFKANTAMFIIISGFTTALQLRRERTTNDQSQDTTTVSSSSKIWFNWRRFLFTRAVGIFPMLWLVLILETPRWNQFNDHAMRERHIKLSRGDEVGCVILYMIGGQMYVDKCTLTGPNEHVGYANQIWNCFLIYTAFRIIFNFFQSRLYTKQNNTHSTSSSHISHPSVSNTLLGYFQLNTDIKKFPVNVSETSQDDDVHTNTNTHKNMNSNVVDKNTNTQWDLRSILIALGENRPSPVLFLWSLVIWTNPSAFIPNFIIMFFIGVMTASILESLHYLLHERPPDKYTAYPISILLGTGTTDTNTNTGTASEVSSLYLVVIRGIHRFLPDVIIFSMGLMFSPLNPPM